VGWGYSAHSLLESTSSLPRPIPPLLVLVLAYFFFIFILFICAYNVWVISPPLPPRPSLTPPYPSLPGRMAYFFETGPPNPPTPTSRVLGLQAHHTQLSPILSFSSHTAMLPEFYVPCTTEAWDVGKGNGLQAVASNSPFFLYALCPLSSVLEPRDQAGNTG
jgi:hypothetical protein